MSTWAHLRDSVVTNIERVFGAAYTPGTDVVSVADGADVREGDLWDGKAFNRPPPPVPVSVSNADMRIVLQGHFLPDGRSMFTAIQSMLQGNLTSSSNLPDNDPNRRKALAGWTRWDMGNFFLRAEPMINDIRDAFGFTDAQVDALFVEADNLG